MSDLDIEIKVDPTQAVTGAKKIASEVAQTEAAGAKARATFAQLGEVFRKIGQEQVDQAAAALARMRQQLTTAGAGFSALGNQFRFAGHSADQMEDAFSSLEKEMKRDEATAKLLGQTLIGQTSKGFASLTDAIKREQDMLKSIHGDMAAYQRDVQTLDALQKKGVITAKEYAAAKSQSRSNAGIADPTAAVSLPGLPKASGGGGASSGLAAMAGELAGPAAALAIGKEVLDSWMEYDQAQNNAFNTLRKYAPDVASTNTILDQQAHLASALSESLENTVGAFSAVREATSNLYLTTRQQTDITRTLGESMTLNGKPISDVAGLMERLQADMELGTMSGGEFKTLLRSFPDIVEMWGDKMGKSSTQLLEMARNGKLGTTEMKQLFAALQDGSETHAKYAERQQSTTDKIKDFLSLGHAMAENTAREGEESATASQHLAEHAEMYRALAAGANAMNPVLKVTLDQFAKSGPLTLEQAEYYKEMANKAHELTPELDALLKRMREEADLWPQLILLHVDAANSIEKINNAMQGQIALTKILTGIAITKQQTDAWGLVHQLSGQDDARALDQKRQKLNMLRAEIEKSPLTNGFTDFDKSLQLDEVDRAMENLTGGMKDMSSVIEAQRKKWQELQAARVAAWKPVTDQLMASGKDLSGDTPIQKMFDNEFDKWMDAHGELDPNSDFEVVGTDMRSEKQAGRDEQRGIMHDNLAQDFGSGLDASLPASPSDINADTAKLDETQKKLIENTKKWNEELKKTDTMTGLIEDQLKSAGAALGDQLVDAAHGAGESWSEFGRNLLDTFEKAIAKALILEAIGSAHGGVGGTGTGLIGMLAGATGLDATMTPAGLRKLPAGATGGDWLAGGAGGTDSQLAIARITPGETFHIRTPQQNAAAAAANSNQGNTTVINQYDSRALLGVMSGPDGGKVIYNWIRQNTPAVKALIG